MPFKYVLEMTSVAFAQIDHPTSSPLTCRFELPAHFPVLLCLAVADWLQLRGLEIPAADWSSRNGTNVVFRMNRQSKKNVH